MKETYVDTDVASRYEGERRGGKMKIRWIVAEQEKPRDIGQTWCHVKALGPDKPNIVFGKGYTDPALGNEVFIVGLDEDEHQDAIDEGLGDRPDEGM